MAMHVPFRSRRSIGSYSVGPVLGYGTTCVVREGTHRETKLPVALKLVKKSCMAGSSLERIKKEIAILRKLRHPHIVRLHDVIKAQGRFCMVLEKVNGGELFEYIYEKGALDREETLRICAQLVLALEHCHSRGIFHRDLKPENILLDERKHIKLTDFGLAHMSEETEICRTACGSPQYASPEVVKGQPYNGRFSDIWSLGVVLYVCATGHNAFNGEDNLATLRSVLRADYEIPETVDEDIADLIRKMMQLAPEKRITFSGIKAHRSFQQTNYFLNTKQDVDDLIPAFSALSTQVLGIVLEGGVNKETLRTETKIKVKEESVVESKRSSITCSSCTTPTSSRRQSSSSVEDESYQSDDRSSDSDDARSSESAPKYSPSISRYCELRPSSFRVSET